MVPNDLRKFLLFCMVWAIIMAVGIYFAIKDADKKVSNDGDRR